MTDYIFRAAVKDQEILLLDKEGMVYMGQRITDAGEAGAAWIETMKMMQESLMRKPLSDDEIEKEFDRRCELDCCPDFSEAVRWAEKMHDIGETE